MADSSAAADFTIAAAAFSMVQLAFVAFGGMGASYIWHSPSQARLQEWRDLIEGWKKWMNSLTDAERDLLEAQTPGMLTFMSDTLFDHALHVERLALDLRASSWTDRYIPFGVLRAVFTNAERAIGVMDKEFLATTGRLRPAPPPPQLSSSRGRDYPGPPQPIVIPHSMQAQDIESAAAADSERAETIIETRRRSMLAYLRLDRIDSKSLRDVVARANETIGNVIRAAQEYRDSLRRGP
ncbi:hypothetical protein OH77DRAFT_1523061 [Trametes cingulata]|nr:hypothetical protein OH77DRAFT_1523061 [Trametes cingulata]